MIYKYSQLKERSKYDKKYDKIIMHFGQLKLLFSEMLFLSKYSEDGNKVLYIGAASGYHISLLADLFPKLTFDLWDAGKFNLEQRDNIKIFHKYFTNSDAQEYKKEGKNILLISDIRNLDIQKYRHNMKELDKLITSDMNKQKEWTQIIKPKAAYLKFRLPYEKGTTEYFDGKIYLQPFSPQSTESRILVTDYNKMKKYDNTEFDEKLAYVNCCIRGSNDKYDMWDKIMDEYNIVNNWDTTYAFYIIAYYLRKQNKGSDVGKLFKEIIEYHEKDNKNKYKNLYRK